MKRTKNKKFKKIALSLAVGTALLSPLMLSGCDKNNDVADNSTEAKIKEVYALAVSYGYEGTYDEWLESIKGEEGDRGDTGLKGDKGADGVTPTIGSDGFWYIGTTNTGKRAVNSIVISNNNTWVINGVDTGVSVKGDDGISPSISISDDGYWVINGTKSQNKAQGEAGVSIVNVEMQYNYDDDGELKLVLTFYYSNGTSSVVSSPVPKRVVNAYLSSYYCCLDGSGNLDGLKMIVTYEGGEEKEIPITNAMIQSGIDDFTEVGEYHNVQFKYSGITFSGSVIILPAGEPVILFDFDESILQYLDGADSCGVWGTSEGHGNCVINIPYNTGNGIVVIKSLAKWTYVDTNQTIINCGNDDYIYTMQINQAGKLAFFTEDLSEETPTKTYSGTISGAPAEIKSYAFEGLEEGYEVYTVAIADNVYYTGVKQISSDRVMFNGEIYELIDDAFEVALFEVGNTMYSSLSKAIENVDEDGTINIYTDVVIDETVEIDKNITLNLNNNKITTSAGILFTIGANVTINNGEIESLCEENTDTIDVLNANGETPAGNLTLNNVALTTNGRAIHLEDGTNLTLNNAEINSTYYGIRSDGQSSARNTITMINSEISITGENGNTAIRLFESQLNMDSLSVINTSAFGVTCFKNAMANISGKITAGVLAVSTNGLIENSGVEITINEGAEITTEGDVGIYMNNTNTLVINGGTITGTTALYIKSGKTIINGGTFVGTTQAQFAHNNNGCYGTGEAIVIETCNYPAGRPQVEINAIDSISNYDDSETIAYYIYNNATEAEITNASTYNINTSNVS